MELFNDLIDYIGSLTITEIWFFMIFMIFLIAVVTLIYVIKMTDENETTEETKPDIIEEEQPLIEEPLNFLEEYLNKQEEMKQEDKPPVSKEAATILEITKNLEQYDDSNIIDLTEFEKDQEEKAIISYDELLKHKNDLKITYDNDYYDDEATAEISIKKIDMKKQQKEEVKEVENIPIDNIVHDTSMKVEVMSYEQEESFLAALKQLQNVLQ